jgi:hypothetical protein
LVLCNGSFYFSHPRPTYIYPGTLSLSLSMLRLGYTYSTASDTLSPSDTPLTYFG